MDNAVFRKQAHELVDWIADYFENIERYSVMSQVEPGEIFNQFDDSPPESPVPFEKTFNEFINKIIPGITHWQSPNFFAYFPASNSYPSILGEMLTAAIGAQCMIWQTSPAAAELEEKVMNWLRQMLGLPETFKGVIQDTASTATLCSILTAREKLTNYRINENGFSEKQFSIYCSSEAHSSIEKAIKIAGFGKNSLRKIPVNFDFSMNTDNLDMQMEVDTINGFTPLCVVAAFGTTGSTAVDDIYTIGEICKKYGAWLHIDAAFAGTALLLPEFRQLINGIEYADSFVFNPHKWMLTNFDCSAYFVKDPEALVKTFEINPEYLKTNADKHVNNYRDWGIQLGRRFRALKLWMVIQTYGVEGLMQKVRTHLELTKHLMELMRNNPEFEILAPVNFNVVCFCFHPKYVNSVEKLNKINEELLMRLNKTGKVYFTHTKLNGIYAIRFVIAQNLTEERNIDKAWELILEIAHGITD